MRHLPDQPDPYRKAPPMDLQTANELHARMTFRAKNHPTRVGSALRAVIDKHAPEAVGTQVVCNCDLSTYPCATAETIGDELGVLPGSDRDRMTPSEVLTELPPKATAATQGGRR